MPEFVFRLHFLFVLQIRDAHTHDVYVQTLFESPFSEVLLENFCFCHLVSEMRFFWQSVVIMSSSRMLYYEVYSGCLYLPGRFLSIFFF